MELRLDLNRFVRKAGRPPRFWLILFCLTVRRGYVQVVFPFLLFGFQWSRLDHWRHIGSDGLGVFDIGLLPNFNRKEGAKVYWFRWHWVHRPITYELMMERGD